MKRTESRKRTPWDGVSELTETQGFLREHYAAHYADRHRALGESGEADMIMTIPFLRKAQKVNETAVPNAVNKFVLKLYLRKQAHFGSAWR
jgi:hypothetical protein